MARSCEQCPRYRCESFGGDARLIFRTGEVVDGRFLEISIEDCATRNASTQGEKEQLRGDLSLVFLLEEAPRELVGEEETS